MSFSVTGALRDGLRRTVGRHGWLLAAAFLAVRLASRAANDTLTRADVDLARGAGAIPQGGVVGALFSGLASTATPLSLGLSLPVAAVLVVVVAVLAEAVRIVAVRTMVADPGATLTAQTAGRHLVRATGNGVVGGLAVYALSLAGLAVLVVPGLLIAVSFSFVRQEIAVEDTGVVAAMGRSWALTTGHRLELFALGLAIAAVTVVAASVGTAVGAVAPAAGAVVDAAVQSVVVVFGVASVSRAYVELDAQATVGGAGAADEPFSYEGALTADDLPPPDDGFR